MQPLTIPDSQIQPLKEDFNRQITLTGYHLNEPLRQGDKLQLALFWLVESPVEVDFTQIEKI